MAESEWWCTTVGVVTNHTVTCGGGGAAEGRWRGWQEGVTVTHHCMMRMVLLWHLLYSVGILWNGVDRVVLVMMVEGGGGGGGGCDVVVVEEGGGGGGLHGAWPVTPQSAVLRRWILYTHRHTHALQRGRWCYNDK